MPASPNNPPRATAYMQNHALSNQCGAKKRMKNAKLNEISTVIMHKSHNFKGKKRSQLNRKSQGKSSLLANDIRSKYTFSRPWRLGFCFASLEPKEERHKINKNHMHEMYFEWIIILFARSITGFFH